MKLGIVVRDSFLASFRKLMQQKIPVKTSFKLRGISKLVNDEIAKYNDTKEGLINEFAERDGDGKPIREVLEGKQTIRLEKTKIEMFLKKLKELEEIEVSFPPVSLSELGKESELTLLPEDYANLDFIQE